MNVELLYTSAPQGLKQGSRGFCTVLSTQGMPINLASKLESLSGYRHVFPSGTPEDEKNPVCFSHLRLSLAGKTVSILSRIAAYGLDYSQRTNKIAHHVVIDEAMPPCGPAALLQHPAFMRERWDGECKTVGSPSLPNLEVTPFKCQQWESLTGDAGWGGRIADAWIERQGKPLFVIFSVEQSSQLLGLLAESLALLPANKRWQATFGTYVTTLPPDVDCKVRCVIAGSEEAKMATARGVVIDLTNANSFGPLTLSAGVTAARQGTFLGGEGQSLPPQIAPSISPDVPAALKTPASTPPLGMKTDEFDPDNPFGGEAAQPPELAPRSTRPSRKSMHDEAVRKTYKRSTAAHSSKKTLILVACVLLLLIAGGGTALLVFTTTQFGQLASDTTTKVENAPLTPPLAPEPSEQSPPSTPTDQTQTPALEEDSSQKEVELSAKVGNPLVTNDQSIERSNTNQEASKLAMEPEKTRYTSELFQINYNDGFYLSFVGNPDKKLPITVGVPGSKLTATLELAAGKDSQGRLQPLLETLRTNGQVQWEWQQLVNGEDWKPIEKPKTEVDLLSCNLKIGDNFVPASQLRAVAKFQLPNNDPSEVVVEAKSRQRLDGYQVIAMKLNDILERSPENLILPNLSNVEILNNQVRGDRRKTTLEWLIDKRGIKDATLNQIKLEGSERLRTNIESLISDVGNTKEKLRELNKYRKDIHGVLTNALTDYKNLLEKLGAPASNGNTKFIEGIREKLRDGEKFADLKLQNSWKPDDFIGLFQEQFLEAKLANNKEIATEVDERMERVENNVYNFHLRNNIENLLVLSEWWFLREGFKVSKSIDPKLVPKSLRDMYGDFQDSLRLVEQDRYLHCVYCFRFRTDDESSGKKSEYTDTFGLWLKLEVTAPDQKPGKNTNKNNGKTKSPQSASSTPGAEIKQAVPIDNKGPLQ